MLCAYLASRSARQPRASTPPSASGGPIPSWHSLSPPSQSKKATKPGTAKAAAPPRSSTAKTTPAATTTARAADRRDRAHSLRRDPPTLVALPIPRTARRCGKATMSAPVAATSAFPTGQQQRGLARPLATVTAKFQEKPCELGFAPGRRSLSPFRSPRTGRVLSTGGGRRVSGRGWGPAPSARTRTRRKHDSEGGRVVGPRA